MEELIQQANDQWDNAEGRKEDDARMLPLVRLRVRVLVLCVSARRLNRSYDYETRAHQYVLRLIRSTTAMTPTMRRLRLEILSALDRTSLAVLQTLGTLSNSVERKPSTVCSFSSEFVLVVIQTEQLR